MVVMRKVMMEVIITKLKAVVKEIDGKGKHALRICYKLHWPKVYKLTVNGVKARIESRNVLVFIDFLKPVVSGSTTQS